MVTGVFRDLLSESPKGIKLCRFKRPVPSRPEHSRRRQSSNRRAAHKLKSTRLNHHLNNSNNHRSVPRYNRQCPHQPPSAPLASHSNQCPNNNPNNRSHRKVGENQCLLQCQSIPIKVHYRREKDSNYPYQAVTHSSRQPHFNLNNHRANASPPLVNPGQVQNLD